MRAMFRSGATARPAFVSALLSPRISTTLKLLILAFIDANMRELKETGYMSNRGRQNVASFFTKDMGNQDWRLGAEVMHSVTRAALHALMIELCTVV